MSRVRSVTAIASCAALAVGLAGLWTNQAVSSVPNRDQAKARMAAVQDEQGARTAVVQDEQSARMAAAQDLLSARAAAVRARSKSAWMATVDRPGSTFGGRQSLVFDNFIKLPLVQFSYGAVKLAPGLAALRAQQVGPKAWVATVPGTFSLAGFDRAPRSFEATYTLVHRPGGWRIADDTDGVTALQMWDLPGLSVLRGRSSMVIGNAPEARMRAYSAMADSAVRRVNGIWGTDWNARVVIVTPSTSEQFARLVLPSADKGLDQVAAVAQGLIQPGQRAKGDWVVINPKTFTALQPDGRRVVITHELTHVAARSSTTRPVPLWLSEGMAEYVGYSGLGFPRQLVASELLTLVRAGKGPKALPTAAEFEPSRTNIAQSYSESWLAVSHLVDLYGQARVLAFYRAIAGRLPVDQAVRFDPDAFAAQAFPQIFGVTQAQFVESWKRYLETLAHTRG